MISWWLILIAVVIAVITIATIIYLLVLFQAEEDRSQAWFPKVVVVAGLSLAAFNVLLLPYDVANRQDPTVFGSEGGGLNTTVAWQIVLYCIAGFVLILVPFAMMYYEAQDPDQKSILEQIKPALIYTIVAFFIFVILLIILWLTIGTANIDYYKYIGNPVNAAPSAVTYGFASDSSSDTLEVKVSFFVYLCALMSVIGWIVFFLFAGVGLVAFPMDFIRNFRDRPKPINGAEYAMKKVEIAKETQVLIEAGKKLDEKSNKNSRKHRKAVAGFKRQVNQLERYYEKLEISYRQKGGQLLMAILQLILGCLGVVLSVAWILHIILYNAAKVTPFLNNMFIAMDNAFQLFGVLAYGAFAFYLLWCVVKGCTKVGVNLLLFTVYPMEVNKTLMNAFVFNTGLILITSVTVVEFCANSFDQYAANTSVNALFTVYATKLKYLGYVLKYFQYPLLAISFLSLLWLLICPQRKVEEDEDDD
eukprot:GILI01017269.1.p1 GENE.GILI01017269.1~~GILI01017269.1.p1  ORF type:complete len:475 (-),score=110.88 GILI01017269.1:163-1587(-)